MITKLKSISKEKYWNYFILVARFYIGGIFLVYGFSKLFGGQFGITETELLTPIKDLSLFKISWYLFDHQPFKAYIGISQIICGLLLIINRTVILGAFMFLPIITTILIIDLSFMPSVLAIGFAWRLPFYIFLDFLILWHYKDKMKIIWNAVWNKMSAKFKFPIWAYLILPIMAIGLEILGSLPKMIANLVFHPKETLERFMKLLELFN